jgi:hypothetical protein
VVQVSQEWQRDVLETEVLTSKPVSRLVLGAWAP